MFTCLLRFTLLFLMSSRTSAFAPSLPLLSTNETAGYPLGLFIGTSARSFIRASLSTDPLLSYLLSLSKYQSLFTEMMAWHAQQYPVEFDEVRGMADGAGVPLRHLFLVNVEYDIANNVEIVPSTVAGTRIGSCTDLVGRVTLGHNEDEDSRYATGPGFPYLLRTPTFTTFVYPGQLPGGAFAWATAGAGAAASSTATPFFSLSVNALFPNSTVLVGAVAQTFALRHAMLAPSWSDAIAYLSTTPVASGFSANLVSPDLSTALNLETSPAGAALTYLRDLPTVPTPLPHMNDYLHFADQVSQRIETSSVHRLRRWHEVKPGDSLGEVAAFLGDRADTAYPVYRQDEHGVTTLATYLVDLPARTVLVFVAQNPATTPHADAAYSFTF